MMHCATSLTDAVCWEDGQEILDPTTGAVIGPYPGFTATFTADWDGQVSYLTNIVGTIPTYMPFLGWPGIDYATWLLSIP